MNMAEFSSMNSIQVTFLSSTLVVDFRGMIERINEQLQKDSF